MNPIIEKRNNFWYVLFDDEEHPFPTFSEAYAFAMGLLWQLPEKKITVKV